MQRIRHFDPSVSVEPTENPWRRLGLKRLVLTTLMFAVSSSRHEKALLAFERFRMTAAEQGRRHDQETTVDHALMRGLVTAGPVMRRGASSV